MINVANIIHTTLQKAHKLFQGGNLQAAEAQVRSLLRQYPSEANSLHLLGLILKSKGEFTEAKKKLLSALENGAEFVAVKTSIGNVYYAEGRYDEALSIYDEVLTQCPSHVDALYNSSLSAIALGLGDVALEKSKSGLMQFPDMIQFQYSLARAYDVLNNCGEAEKTYTNILKTNPSHYHTLYSYAVSLKRSGRFEDALIILLRIVKYYPNAIDAWFILANINYQLGKPEDAIAAFKKVLALNPAHVEAHRFLNNLYHEFGYEKEFAESFTLGIKHDPSSIPLRLAQIDALLESKQYDECALAIEQACLDLDEQWIFNARKGTLASRQGDLEQAAFYMERAHNLKPEDTASTISLARFNIGLQREEKALTLLDKVEAQAPYDQNLWALRGAVWTLLGEHKKADWLFGYDRYVQAVKLETPSGYQNIQEFLSALKTRLEALHTTAKAPLNQTLRHGTQTIGNLFDHGDEILNAYKKALSVKIKEVINSLPYDADHPFLSRNTGKFDIATSWSVRLTKAGFHVSHIHPVGWLSSAFYVAFDTVTVSDDISKPEGWLHFGAPGIDLPGRKIAPIKKIKPEPGLLALFPSYCWHGTYPVEHDGMRLTAPFDVVPV